MENQHTARWPTRSGYTGDGLLAFLSVCLRCGLENKAYYVYANQEMKERMRDDHYDSNLTGTFHNCQTCFSVYRVQNTAKWLGKVPREEVDRDLEIMGDGTVSIDFDAAEQQAKSDVKGERDYSDWQLENADRIAWGRKRVP